MTGKLASPASPRRDGRSNLWYRLNSQGMIPSTSRILLESTTVCVCQYNRLVLASVETTTRSRRGGRLRAGYLAKAEIRTGFKKHWTLDSPTVLPTHGDSTDSQTVSLVALMSDTVTRSKNKVFWEDLDWCEGRFVVVIIGTRWWWLWHRYW